jgi:hypothetical protein
MCEGAERVGDQTLCPLSCVQMKTHLSLPQNLASYHYYIAFLSKEIVVFRNLAFRISKFRILICQDCDFHGLIF